MYKSRDYLQKPRRENKSTLFIGVMFVMGFR